MNKMETWRDDTPYNQAIFDKTGLKVIKMSDIKPPPSEVHFDITDSTSYIDIETKEGYDDYFIELDRIKDDSEIIAIYNKNKFKFDEIINIVKKNVEILDISTDDADLEDVFLEVTNN